MIDSSIGYVDYWSSPFLQDKSQCLEFFPIALDNGFKLWRAYGNRYWPAFYLIDKNGVVRYTHFGEGRYKETEAAIVSLLE